MHHAPVSVLSRAVLALFVASLSPPADVSAQQELQEKHFIRDHIYVAFGIGGGVFTPTCDTGCTGDRLNANAVLLYVGWPIGKRLRLEFGAQRVQSTGQDTGGNHASSVSLGLSAYLTRSLFVRGGVSRLGFGAPDKLGAPIEGSGGPGISAGAGYDLFLGKGFALTPYVSAFAGSLKNLEYFSGVNTIPTAGKENAIHGGLFITYRPWPRRGK